jgi:hypothetical protein
MSKFYTYFALSTKFLKLSILSLILCFLAVIIASATDPIPNAGFENWSGGNPVGWVTSNEPGTDPIININQSNESHNGSSSAKGIIINYHELMVPCALSIGVINPAIPISSKPGSVHGWYKFTSNGGDILQIATGFKKGDNLIGYGIFRETASKTGFTEFNISTIYIPGNDIPDSASITINIVTDEGTLHENSSFIIDDLSFGAASDGVNDEFNTIYGFALNQNFPNPCKQLTQIDYGLPTSSFVTIKLYNIFSEEVMTLVSKDETEGKHNVTFDASNLASGNYLYTIQAGSNTLTKIMTVLK